MEFADAFMGHVGFDELKRHCKQGDEFGREVLSIMNERAACELAYGKSLKRLGQRLSKACTNLIASPLSTLWRTISAEMEMDADAHRKFSASLNEQCVKASSPILENISKCRKTLETDVESAAKTMSDSLLEHSKVKKRHHQLSKEKESILEQLEGARPKTKNDEARLGVKESKTEVLLTRANDDYYDSLIELQRRQIEWELTSRNSCSKIQELEHNKTDRLCRVAMSYSSLLSGVLQQLSSSCEQIKQHCSNLDPSGELRVVVESRKTSRYQTEFILCDYFGENFRNVVRAERRVSSLTKPLEKFLGDLQKEQTHYDGMQRLIKAQSVRANEDEKLELEQKLEGITTMLSYLDINRAKLQKAIATVNGNSVVPHSLVGSIQQYYDKQGIMHSTLKISAAQNPNDEDVFTSSQAQNPAPNMTQRHVIHRSQSEKVHTIDDIDVGKKGRRLKSFDTRGTLTAKQLQSLSYGMGYSRKQAPAPPVQNYSEVKPSCVAKYRYDSRQHDELTIEEGDVIRIIEKCDADWWKGELNGLVGIFPATYVDIM